LARFSTLLITKMTAELGTYGARKNNMAVFTKKMRRAENLCSTYIQSLLMDYMLVCCWPHPKTDDLARLTQVGLKDINLVKSRKYIKI